jgi:hypothetical protein
LYVEKFDCLMHQNIIIMDTSATYKRLWLVVTNEFSRISVRNDHATEANALGKKLGPGVRLPHGILFKKNLSHPIKEGMSTLGQVN